METHQELLRRVGDMERILARVALRSARPRDLIQLRSALAALPELHSALRKLDSPRLSKLTQDMGEFPELHATLAQAIVESPPLLIRDGGVIAAGYDADLDQLRQLSEDAGQVLLEIEVRERTRTGIPNLKVGYNRVHGYYIEISRTQADKAPAEYARRQTLKGVERYITPELKAFEEKILGARERALAREKVLYEGLLDLLAGHLGELQRSAAALAELDVLHTFGERAESLGLSAPAFTDTPGIEIHAGRHPVVEQVLDQPFVPNDLSLDEDRRMLVITGPNMGGKSTYMRQTALIVLLAYTGSFIPAERAVIGPVDRIFTRIGAADDLAGGRSTFMVEMTETANILHNATPHSLVLVDEIGRGTSTFDGMSLAWACADQLAQEIRAFTLFATHYFELTALAEQIDGIANVHLEAVEHGDRIVFMHTVREGPANQSYGLQVAALAGVPRPVIDKARRHLAELELTYVQKEDRHQQLQLFAPPPKHALEAAVSELVPDDCSPRQALETLYRLKAMLNETGG